MRNAQQRGQGERLQDREIGRQQRRNLDRIGQLPGKELSFVRVRLTLPIEYAKEIQPHRGVRVFKHPGDPAAGLADNDPEFFMQFARQRRLQGFARLDLAAGEFPVTRIDLARRPLRQQHAAVRLGQHSGNDFGDGLACAHLAACPVARELPRHPAIACATPQRPLQRGALEGSSAGAPNEAAQWRAMSR